MKRIAEYKIYVQWLVMLSAMILPFFIIRTFSEFYHTSDVDDLWRWSQAWKTDWHDIYINCERCNYPFVGTLLSGGVISLIDIENFDHLANRFRYYLAAIDAMNVLLVWFILQRLQVKRAPLWAGIIGLLPSSWLGSSVWGQIDGIGQFLILSFFLLLIWFNQEMPSTRRFFLFALVSGFLLSLMLLTKQLIYFSIFALGLIFLATLLKTAHKPREVFSSLLVAAGAFILPVILVDLNLNLKPPYVSHLQYILATGSAHGNVIAYTGFNLWVFFFTDMLGSSQLPLLPGLSFLTPQSVGIFLFLLINVFLAIAFARQLRKVSPLDASRIVWMSLIYFALVNLSFNLTLTGTHERYLYHFYPFILVACLAAFANRTILAALFSGSLIYGAFLFGYLTGFVRANSVEILRVVGIVHIALFIFLVLKITRDFSSQAYNSTSS